MIDENEFYERLGELAKTNLVVKALMVAHGSFDTWPAHLKADALEKLKLRPVQMYEVIE